MMYLKSATTLLFATVLSLAAASATRAADNSALPSPALTLVVLNCPEYVDPEPVATLEQPFNARISNRFFESEALRDDMMLETNGTGYELVTANRVNLRSYRKRGWLTQLDEQKMPNLRHIDRHRLDAFVALNEQSALVSGDVKESPARSEFYTRLPPRAARAPDIAFSRIVQ